MKSLPPVRSLLSLAVTSALMGTSFIVTHAAEADTTETGTASTSTVLTPAYSVSPTGLMIEITKSQPQALSQSLQTLQPAPVTDGGELLKSLNGISGTRMGGRAIDPIIRGQKQTAINVLLDGAYLHGGCPNRMDPPTTYTAVDSYDWITVIKGNRTVQYGGGGSGGTVLFERKWPQFNDKPVTGSASSSYESQGGKWELAADIAAGSEQGYIRVIGHTAEGDNYEDGDGNEVRSAYKSQSGTLMAGYALSNNTRIQGSFEKAEETDVLFPGAGMDSPYARSENIRLKLDHQFTNGSFKTLKAELYQSDVEHLMDNYSLRDLTAAMKMDAPSTSDTQGGRIVLTGISNRIDWLAGLDLQKNTRNANQQLPMMMSKIAGIQWPDAEIQQVGLFGEAEYAIDAKNRIKGGLRIDQVETKANRVSEAFTGGMMAGKTPEMLYGTGETDQEESNVGGFIHWNHNINALFQWETIISRSVRTADATERYIATSKWIGNPELEPEKHHQLEGILSVNMGAAKGSLSGWVNKVDDYILRSNISGKDRYSNVDATLMGIEAEASHRINANWLFSTQLAWIKGENDDNGEALSQISPLELRAKARYLQNNWQTGIELISAAKQDEVCLYDDANCGGQDVRKTPSYWVANLDAQYQIQKGLSLEAGINNLFDENYTLHESRNDTFNPNPIQVAEPGRSVWLKAHYKF